MPTQTAWNVGNAGFYFPVRHVTREKQSVAYYFEAGGFKTRQCGTARKVMKMPNVRSCCKQRSLPYNRLGRYIERNVKHEPIGYGPQRAKEADVVFDVLEDIEA